MTNEAIEALEMEFNCINCTEELCEQYSENCDRCKANRAMTLKYPTGEDMIAVLDKEQCIDKCDDCPYMKDCKAKNTYFCALAILIKEQGWRKVVRDEMPNV